MKLMKSTMLVLAVIALTPTITLRAGDVNRGNRLLTDKIRMERARELAFLLAPIKTKADLDQYLAELRQNPEARSPLNLLSPAARDRFLNSLVFTERGLGGFQYHDLQAQLTASQIYQVLALFGAQDDTPLIKGARIENKADEIIMFGIAPVDGGSGDYIDYECSGRATCHEAAGYICKSNC